MSTSSNPLIERLFSVGAHFGFSKSRRHPSTAPFIFGSKQGNDIFDLEQTAELIAAAKAIIEEAGKNGKTVLFVGTKNEVSVLVKAAADSVDMPFVVNRWIGGMLTNFTQMSKRFDRLKSLHTEKESGELDRKYTKKERVLIGREIDKLTFNFGGIFNLERIPDLLVVVDPRHDHIATTEAIFAKVPVIGIMSSDSNIKQVTYPILVNDALQGSVDLVLRELTASYAEGKKTYVAPVRPARIERRPRFVPRPQQ
ncbi:MAG: 30S ribosomal protein S2 [Parcubacteria group bacterium CG2_30_44_11]|nr:MAG: 30S ribosomal protein S2 [Parcubacteria group bacterium CG2_30_44_11]